jgi:hypothetical protein
MADFLRPLRREVVVPSHSLLPGAAAISVLALGFAVCSSMLLYAAGRGHRAHPPAGQVVPPRPVVPIEVLLVPAQTAPCAGPAYHTGADQRVTVVFSSCAATAPRELVLAEPGPLP